MPVIPSFTGFAPRPDVAGAAQRRQQLQQQAQEAAMRFHLQHQQLAQQREMADMQNAIRMRELDQTARLQAQKLTVDTEYQKQALALKDREVSAQEARYAADAQSILQRLNAKEGYQRDLEAGLSPVDAMVKWGPQMGYAPTIRGGEDSVDHLPTVADLITTPEGDALGYGVQTSRSARRILPGPAEGVSSAAEKRLYDFHLGRLNHKRAELTALLRSSFPDEEEVERVRTELGEMEKEFEKMIDPPKQGAPPSAIEDEPAPDNPADRKEGHTYQLPNGLRGVWRGRGWELVR